MKLSPGVNFINVFTHSFCACRSWKHKKLVDLTVFFALLGSACIKAAHKHVDEIDPRSSSSKRLPGKCISNVATKIHVNTARGQFQVNPWSANIPYWRQSKSLLFGTRYLSHLNLHLCVPSGIWMPTLIFLQTDNLKMSTRNKRSFSIHFVDPRIICCNADLSSVMNSVCKIVFALECWTYFFLI